MFEPIFCKHSREMRTFAKDRLEHPYLEDDFYRSFSQITLDLHSKFRFWTKTRILLIFLGTNIRMLGEQYPRSRNITITDRSISTNSTGLNFVCYKISDVGPID